MNTHSGTLIHDLVARVAHVDKRGKVHPVEIDRIAVVKDFGKHQPNHEAFARALGMMQNFVTDNVMRNCLEKAIWPGRLDFDTCYREAYKVIQCQACDGDGKQCQQSSLPGQDMCGWHQ